MRRRVVGAALTVVGVLMLLFAPNPNGYVVCGASPGTWECPDYRTSFAAPIHWPRVWAHYLTLPMALIGVALVVIGVVLVVKRRRSRRSPVAG
jgi:drug/metabolite transporter (DMT)-like permease